MNISWIFELMFGIVFIMIYRNDILKIRKDLKKIIDDNNHKKYNINIDEPMNGNIDKIMK